MNIIELKQQDLLLVSGGDSTGELACRATFLLIGLIPWLISIHYAVKNHVDSLPTIEKQEYLKSLLSKYENCQKMLYDTNEIAKQKATYIQFLESTQSSMFNNTSR